MNLGSPFFNKLESMHSPNVDTIIIFAKKFFYVMFHSACSLFLHADTINDVLKINGLINIITSTIPCKYSFFARNKLYI